MADAEEETKQPTKTNDGPLDPKNVATLHEAKLYHVPLQWRDNCSALLIPLNICRHKTWYLPWKCENERHVYEKCQYDDFKRRQKMVSDRVMKERQKASE